MIRRRKPKKNAAYTDADDDSLALREIEESGESSCPLPSGREHIENIEVDLLLEGLRRRYGYDFTHYSHASVKRRLTHARNEAGLTRFTELLDRLLHDEDFFDMFLKHMSITVTEMFRDPSFYRLVREKLIPVLKTFPFVKIWHAGCATGEEV